MTTPEHLPNRLDALERDVTDHEGRLVAVEAEQAVTSVRLDKMETRITDEIGTSRKEVKDFRDEWREQKRWGRRMIEKVVDKMLPWPFVILVGVPTIVGMLLIAGVQTFGGRLGGQEFHVGQRQGDSNSGADDVGVSGAGTMASPEP